jgi:ABC-2 type transport system permease protein
MAMVSAAPARDAQRGNALVAFLAILRRDIAVTGRELPVFLAQVILQPLGLLFVFGRVLTDLGFTNPAYAKQLFPGIVAMTIMLTALQSVALPLVIEFSFTKEIEDRLLAPLPASWVAAEKVVFAAGRAIIAGLVMFPVGWLVLGGIPFDVHGLPLLIGMIILGALAGGAMGLTLGTAVTPQRINIMFAIVLTPLIFTGCSQYPWPSLSKLPWFQVLTLFNPLTYLSEGTRAALLPDGPHMATWIPPLALLAAVLAFGYAGMRGFRHRAID